MHDQPLPFLPSLRLLLSVPRWQVVKTLPDLDQSGYSGYKKGMETIMRNYPTAGSSAMLPLYAGENRAGFSATLVILVRTGQAAPLGHLLEKVAHESNPRYNSTRVESRRVQSMHYSTRLLEFPSLVLTAAHLLSWLTAKELHPLPRLRRSRNGAPPSSPFLRSPFTSSPFPLPPIPSPFLQAMVTRPPS